jgi:hypothetical protein
VAESNLFNPGFYFLESESVGVGVDFYRIAFGTIFQQTQTNI